MSIVKRKRKDGSLYVQEVKSKYDPKTKNSRVISSKTLGILPPGETDISKLVPSDNRPFVVAKRQAQAMADKTSTIADNRKQLQVVYPLDIVMVVILLADLPVILLADRWRNTGTCTAASSPTGFNFPNRPISHDTVRSVIKIVGRTNVNDFIEYFTAPLLETFRSFRFLPWTGRPSCRLKPKNTLSVQSLCAQYVRHRQRVVCPAGSDRGKTKRDHSSG